MIRVLVLVVLLAAVPAHAAVVTRGPYLQSNTASSVWEHRDTLCMAGHSSSDAIRERMGNRGRRLILRRRRVPGKYGRPGSGVAHGARTGCVAAMAG